MNTLTTAIQTIDSMIVSGNPIPMKLSYGLNVVERECLVKHIVHATTLNVFGSNAKVDLSNQSIRDFVDMNTNNPIMNDGCLYFTVNDTTTVMEVKTFKRNFPNCVYFDV